MASFTSTLRAVLELDTTPFKNGADQAVKTMKATRQKLGDIGASSFGQYVGVGAVTAGFSAALVEAQRLRDEALKLGVALDPAVARSAELADNLAKGRTEVLAGGMAIVGAVQSLVDKAVAGISSSLGIGDSAAGNLVAIDLERAKETELAQQKAKQAGADRAGEKAKQKADEAERARIIEASGNFEAAAALRERTRYEQLSTEEKIREQIERQARAEALYQNAAAPGVERSAALLTVEQARAALIPLRASREKEVADQTEKHLRAQAEWLDKIIQRTEDQVTAEANLAKAKAAVGKAGSDYATANRDRASFTVDQAASGERGTPAERERAKKIKRLEAEAARAYDRMPGTDIRDAQGNRETGEQAAARKLREADALRKGFGNRLNSGDRDPLAAQKQAFTEALENAKTLTAIAAALTPEAVPKSGS